MWVDALGQPACSGWGTWPRAAPFCLRPGRRPAWVGRVGSSDTHARNHAHARFYCVAESFDRKKLEELLKLTYPPGTVGGTGVTSRYGDRHGAPAQRCGHPQGGAPTCVAYMPSLCAAAHTRSERWSPAHRTAQAPCRHQSHTRTHIHTHTQARMHNLILLA